MSVIKFGCNLCGDLITTQVLAVALAWNRDHDATCVKRDDTAENASKEQS